jgi:predicted Fe-S protein YdhL (DUF1289 family)
MTSAFAIAFLAAAPIFAGDSGNRRRPVIESPCNRLCTLDPASGLCLGCGRSLAEITRWTQMSDAERERLIAELDQRRQTLRPTVI